VLEEQVELLVPITPTNVSFRCCSSFPVTARLTCVVRNLEKAESRVEKLSKALDEVDDRVAELRNKFQVRTTEAAQLQTEVDKANETINAAESLVGKLGDEHQRWSEQVSCWVFEEFFRAFCVAVFMLQQCNIIKLLCKFAERPPRSSLRSNLHVRCPKDELSLCQQLIMLSFSCCLMTVMLRHFND